MTRRRKIFVNRQHPNVCYSIGSLVIARGRTVQVILLIVNSNKLLSVLGIFCTPGDRELNTSSGSGTKDKDIGNDGGTEVLYEIDMGGSKKQSGGLVRRRTRQEETEWIGRY